MNKKLKLIRLNEIIMEQNIAQELLLKTNNVDSTRITGAGKTGQGL
ncbi:hypothetical protein [Sporomusa ovata]|nr:hypothetical protein [Sporomusa ovata]